MTPRPATGPTTRPQTPHSRLRPPAGLRGTAARGRRARTAAGLRATTATSLRAQTAARPRAAAGAGPQNSFAQRRPTQETP
ncbi:hypothetical protein TNCT1_32300 [Streptomyces sp. 1-11]|nr:hypothetical protein TNCT1_32300 [Streptomyces sp. 1-11]